MSAQRPEPDAPTPEPRSLALLTVVAPVYNEEETVGEFCRRTCAALEAVPLELILVDDGSTDSTPTILKRLAAEDERVRVIRLSRNFGHQAAITAGLDHAHGDAVVMLDSDLQDPPELIPEMVGCWRQGSDVVYAVRRVRTGESRPKLVTAGWFYRLFSALSQIELEQRDEGEVEGGLHAPGCRSAGGGPCIRTRGANRDPRDAASPLSARLGSPGARRGLAPHARADARCWPVGAAIRVHAGTLARFRAPTGRALRARARSLTGARRFVAMRRAIWSEGAFSSPLAAFLKNLQETGLAADTSRSLRSESRPAFAAATLGML